MGRGEDTAGADARRPAEARAALLARLRERRGEIEQAILTRIYSVPGPTEAADPEYAEGLRAAVPAALEYCLAGVERGESRPPPIPTALLSQARIAARNEVSLDIVLRRYFAGYTLLGDFLVEEVEEAGLRRAADLKRLLRALAASFDRLLGAVSEEHVRESKSGAQSSSAQRRTGQIQRLLAGERLDATDLNYDLEAHHLGSIAKGPGAGEALCDLARTLDRRLLALSRGEDGVWAWLGGRRAIDVEDLQRVVSSTWPCQIRLAIGEPGQGLGGWRLTHRQACAALPIALRGPESFTRYADVALLASMLQDDLLAISLRELYLDPLARERDGGRVARETLRAYFAAERNVSSTAAALGIKRHTVTNRLRAIEQRVGRPLSNCATEVDAALRLEDLGTPLLPHAASHAPESNRAGRPPHIAQSSPG